MEICINRWNVSSTLFCKKSPFLICGQETSPSLKSVSLKKRGMWRKNNVFFFSFFLFGIFMINWEINRKRQRIKQDRQLNQFLCYDIFVLEKIGVFGISLFGFFLLKYIKVFLYLKKKKILNNKKMHIKKIS